MIKKKNLSLCPNCAAAEHPSPLIVNVHSEDALFVGVSAGSEFMKFHFDYPGRTFPCVRARVCVSVLF